MTWPEINLIVAIADYQVENQNILPLPLRDNR